ncbi:MAG: RidA family protein [Nitratireductor sp.]
MSKRLISSGSHLEPEIGFSRAVRQGNLMFVAGTAPIAPDRTDEVSSDVYTQTQRCLEIIDEALREAGARLSAVVCTRIMLTDIDTWRDAAKAHGEVFGEVRPARTFVEVSRFIDVRWNVEVEADAIT